MKLTRLLVIWLTGPALTGLTAESLSIDWYTVEGGGGTSVAGSFALDGTAGQPDAGVLIHRGPNCESRFALTGGFWSFLSPYWPEGPQLALRFTSTNTVLLSWPAMCQGYALQKTTSLGPPNWANVGPAPALVGGEYQVSLDDLYGCLWLRCQLEPGVFDTTFIGCRSGFATYFGTNAVPPPPDCAYIYTPTNSSFFRLFKP